MELNLYQNHTRAWLQNDYAYPVLSRRAEGISVGINLSPANECNFRCVYCQVIPEQIHPGMKVDFAQLKDELEKCVDFALSGAIFKHPYFLEVPPHQRRINDIAFSGNGEPTLSPLFPKTVELAAEIRRIRMNEGPTEDFRNSAKEMKIVLITNATRLGQDELQDSLDTLLENNGEIWAKLDAGTEEYYRKIDRSLVPFDGILAGITRFAKRRPIVIQTLFSRMCGEVPSWEELEAYAERIRKILDDGGRIRYIQLHSVCRPPICAEVQTLEPELLKEFAHFITKKTGTSVKVF
ncbi:MAG: radical SAM protein [Planctomycetaceae bacterium]|nr:radical SAM protein [Planctomycetaceae bacterium]MDO4424307.1 radical SAM protein [Planctomycetia bacterium]